MLRNVTEVGNDFLCPPCHQLQALFPQGQSYRQRRHYDFITKSMITGIPVLYATEHVPAAQKMIYSHFFVGSCDWYVAELDPTTGDAFGHTDLGLGVPEWGYFNLRELEQMVMNGWLVVERDIHFQPTNVRELGIAQLPPIPHVAESTFEDRRIRRSGPRSLPAASRGGKRSSMSRPPEV